VKDFSTHAPIRAALATLRFGAALSQFDLASDCEPVFDPNILGWNWDDDNIVDIRAKSSHRRKLPAFLGEK
jgi:hypothetical protein